MTAAWWKAPALLLAIVSLGSLVWVTRPEFIGHQGAPHVAAVSRAEYDEHVRAAEDIARQVAAIYCITVKRGRPVGSACEPEDRP